MGCTAATAIRPGQALGVCRIAVRPGSHSSSNLGSSGTGRPRSVRPNAGSRESERRPASGGPSRWRSLPDLPDQPGQNRPKASQTLTLGQASGLLTSHDHHVTSSWKAGLLLGEGLAEKPLDAIALDSATHLPGYGQTQPPIAVGRSREYVQHQLTGGMGPPAPNNAIKVTTLRQPSAPRPRPGGRLRGHTVRRLRPFARRRLRITRPERVNIRARKPWVRARLRFFG